MIAIQTKYYPATNFKGSRIKAFTETGFSAVISYDYSLDGAEIHFKAVKELIKKHNLDWDLSQMRYGGVKGGYVFCFSHSIINKGV